MEFTRIHLLVLFVLAHGLTNRYILSYIGRLLIGSLISVFEMESLKNMRNKNFKCEICKKGSCSWRPKKLQM